MQWHYERDGVSNHRLRLFIQLFDQVQVKENIKAPRHWPLWWEFTGDRWIPRTTFQWGGKYFYLMTSPCHEVWEWTVARTNAIISRKFLNKYVIIQWFRYQLTSAGDSLQSLMPWFPLYHCAKFQALKCFSYTFNLLLNCDNIIYVAVFHELHKPLIIYSR